MIHLAAELIENRPCSRRRHPGRVGRGRGRERLSSRRGPGPRPSRTRQLSDLNRAAGKPAPTSTSWTQTRLGLSFAGLLCRQHSVEVLPHPVAPYRGTKAIVLMPDERVLPGATPTAGGGRPGAGAHEPRYPWIGAPRHPERRNQGRAEARVAASPRRHLQACRRRVRPDKPSQQQSWNPGRPRPCGGANGTRPRQTTRGGGSPPSLQRRGKEAEADDDTRRWLTLVEARRSRMTGGGGWCPPAKRGAKRNGWLTRGAGRARSRLEDRRPRRRASRDLRGAVILSRDGLLLAASGPVQEEEDNWRPSPRPCKLATGTGGRFKAGGFVRRQYRARGRGCCS